MGIEFDFASSMSKKHMIKKLESRGLDYNEANHIAGIVYSAERYKTESFTAKAQLEVLHEILDKGNKRMANIGGTPGPHYREIKRKIKELKKLE